MSFLAGVRFCWKISPFSLPLFLLDPSSWILPEAERRAGRGKDRCRNIGEWISGRESSSPQKPIFGQIFWPLFLMENSFMKFLFWHSLKYPKFMQLSLCIHSRTLWTTGEDGGRRSCKKKLNVLFCRHQEQSDWTSKPSRAEWHGNMSHVSPFLSQLTLHFIECV